MARNKSGFIAGVGILAACLGYFIYGFTTSWGAVPAVVGLAAGSCLVGIEWRRRQPGRAPNPKATKLAWIIGVGLYPLLLVAGASDRLTDQLAVFGAGLIAPLVALVVLATPIVARRRPGYWSR